MYNHHHFKRKQDKHQIVTGTHLTDDLADLDLRHFHLNAVTN